MFDAYRSTMADHGLPGGAGMAFMPLVYTANSEEEAEKGAKELTWYMQTKTPPQFRNPPGYVGVDTNVKALQGAYTGRTDAVRAKGMDYLREQGVLMYGTPDSVAKQVKRYYDLVGGFDHLLMMQQAGFLDHKRTVSSMTLFAKEVYPQIKDLPRTQMQEGESDGLMREGKYISVDGIRTHYFEAGESHRGKKPSMLLLHSAEYGGAAEFSWEFNLPALGRHYHVLAPDHLGFGLTDKIFDFNGQFDRRITHIRRFIEVMGVGPVHVMGSSMSGGLSLTVAARKQPDWPMREPRLLLRRRRRAQQRPAQDHQYL